jgi:hypothetical protein
MRENIPRQLFSKNMREIFPRICVKMQLNLHLAQSRLKHGFSRRPACKPLAGIGEGASPSHAAFGALDGVAQHYLALFD